MSLILPSSELAIEAASLGFVQVIGLMDLSCVCPIVEWLDEFARWVKPRCPRWLSEKRDCEDLSMWAHVQATESLVKNGQLEGVGHAFKICRTPNGWRFFDVQTGLHCDAMAAIARGAVPLRKYIFV